METEKRLKLLQLFYAGALADATGNFDKFGILDQVTEKKAFEQKLMAPGQLAQLEIDSPEKLFESFTEIFGCIRWKVEKQSDNFVAWGNSCLMCTIAKRMDNAQPCYVYCINPLSALVSALEPGWKLDVNQTLWDGSRCEFVLNQACCPTQSINKLKIAL